MNLRSVFFRLNELEMNPRDEGSVSNCREDQAFIIVSFPDRRKHEQSGLVLAQGSETDKVQVTSNDIWRDSFLQD